MTAPATLSCVDVIRELWDYLDGEVDQAKWDAITAHLATCTGCTSHVEFCRSFLAQVAAMPLAPDEVAKMRVRVLAALQADAS